MIFNPGFEKIFDYDISVYYAAVVQDMIASEFEKWTDKTGNKKYFNSGIMYINLKKWRKDLISEKLVHYKKNDLEDHFMDQNALNKVIGGNVLWISPTFNLMASCSVKAAEDYYKDDKGLEHIAYFYNISPSEMENIIRHPAILHVTGPQKAWKDVSADRIDDWIPYVLPDDFLTIVKNYCLTISKDFLQIIDKQDDKFLQMLNQQDKKIVAIRGEKNYFYKIGKKISFKLGGDSVFYIISGFSDCEDWGCWTNGESAELKIFFPELKTNLLLNMEYEVFGNQHILLFANNILIDEYDAVKGNKKITISKDIIQNGELILRFEIPTAKSPSELNINSDTRKLGLGFKEIVFYKNR